MKKLITIFLTLFMLISTAACQPTPEQAIVVKKDTERMIEQAAQPSNGAAIDDVGIPEGRLRPCLSCALSEAAFRRRL